MSLVTIVKEKKNKANKEGLRSLRKGQRTLAKYIIEVELSDELGSRSDDFAEAIVPKVIVATMRKYDFKVVLDYKVERI